MIEENEIGADDVEFAGNTKDDAQYPHIVYVEIKKENSNRHAIMRYVSTQHFIPSI